MSKKVKSPKGYKEAFDIIGKCMMKDDSIRRTWKHHIHNLFTNTLTSARYRLPDMDKLGDDAGETFVTEWINKSFKKEKS